MKRLSHRVSRGFTLIELMVVIAIIAILASTAAPSLQRHITKAKLVEVESYASQLQSAVDEIQISESAFPSKTTLDKYVPNSALELVDSYSISDVDGIAGSIVVSLNENLSIEKGDYLKFSKSPLGAWNCVSNLSPAIAPSYCSNATTEGD